MRFSHQICGVEVSTVPEHVQSGYRDIHRVAVSLTCLTLVSQILCDTNVRFQY